MQQRCSIPRAHAAPRPRRRCEGPMRRCRFAQVRQLFARWHASDVKVSKVMATTSHATARRTPQRLYPQACPSVDRRSTRTRRSTSLSADHAAPLEIVTQNRIFAAAFRDHRRASSELVPSTRYAVWHRPIENVPHRECTPCQRPRTRRAKLRRTASLIPVEGGARHNGE